MSEDSIQTCLNLTEGIRDAAQDVRSFRTHWHRVVGMVETIGPLLERAQLKFPDLGKLENSKKYLSKLISNMEEAVLLMRKCTSTSKIGSLLDNGETKRRIESMANYMESSINEVNEYLENILNAEDATSFASSQSPVEIPTPPNHVQSSNLFISIPISHSQITSTSNSTMNSNPNSPIKVKSHVSSAAPSSPTIPINSFPTSPTPMTLNSHLNNAGNEDSHFGEFQSFTEFQNVKVKDASVSHSYGNDPGWVATFPDLIKFWNSRDG